MIDIQTQTLLRNIVNNENIYSDVMFITKKVYQDALSGTGSPIGTLAKELKQLYIEGIPSHLPPIYLEMLQIELVKIDWRYIAKTLLEEIV